MDVQNSHIGENSALNCPFLRSLFIQSRFYCHTILLFMGQCAQVGALQALSVSKYTGNNFLIKKNLSGVMYKEDNVTMDWQVDDDGAVISPSVVRSNFTDKTFHSCMARKISSWRFPEPPFGGKKYVEHTFKFQDEKK